MAIINFLKAEACKKCKNLLIIQYIHQKHEPHVLKISDFDVEEQLSENSSPDIPCSQRGKEN